jgi:rhomboid protease GluP
MFLHAGLVHLVFNMYALLYIGVYLEPLLGRWRYLTVYIACGVLASLTSTWWRIENVGIGASGAIFGLFGVFLALLTTNFVEKNVRKPMLRSIAILWCLTWLTAL